LSVIRLMFGGIKPGRGHPGNIRLALFGAVRNHRDTVRSRTLQRDTRQLWSR